MPNLAAIIDGFVKGDDLDIIRTISNIPATQIIDDAFLTVRSTNLNTVIFKKHITAVDVPGTGQITDTGGDGEGAVKFQLTNADTVLLVVGTLFPYDIEIITDAGKRYTPEVGTISASLEVTLVADETP